MVTRTRQLNLESKFYLSTHSVMFVVEMLSVEVNIFVLNNGGGVVLFDNDSKTARPVITFPQV